MQKLKLLIIICFLLILTGCWDAIELEEQSFVIAIGVDKGQGQFMDITFQIANPQRGSSQIAEAKSEPPYSLITISAPDRITAKDIANASVSRRLTFSHLKIFILSEEFTKSDQFIGFFEELTRDSTIDRNVNLMVTKEKAIDFINANKPPMETRPHKNYEFMTERYRDTGLVTLSDIDRFLRKEYR